MTLCPASPIPQVLTSLEQLGALETLPPMWHLRHRLPCRHQHSFDDAELDTDRPEHRVVTKTVSNLALQSVDHRDSADAPA